MNAQETARWEMVEAGGRTAQSFGLNRLLGQLYMYLFLTKDALSLDELAEGVGVSKASVSITCRQLENWGALKRVWKKGDRKDYYEAQTEFGRILNNGLKTSLQKKLESAKIQIERSLEYIENDKMQDEAGLLMQDRLKQAEQFRVKLEKVLKNPIINTLLKLQ